MTDNIRSSMESYGTRWSGNPNDPNAPEETRPDGCTCTYQTDEMLEPESASGHDDQNENCPLFVAEEPPNEKET